MKVPCKGARTQFDHEDSPQDTRQEEIKASLEVHIVNNSTEPSNTNFGPSRNRVT